MDFDTICDRVVLLSAAQMRTLALFGAIFALVALAFTATPASADDADAASSETAARGNLIVQKRVIPDPTHDNPIFAQNKNITVEINIYNVGNGYEPCDFDDG